MNGLYDRPELSLLVTDSGLGGLSIFAALERAFRRHRPFRAVTMTYFNAWPDQGQGYNNLPDMTERARVFNQALRSMAKFRPDLILIACNTLSVIYPYTRFSRTTRKRVQGIVDLGVEMIRGRMQALPGSRVILFATPTTIEGDAHRAGLVAAGIAAERIVPLACPGLAGRIENDPTSLEVSSLIDRCCREAGARLQRGGPVLAALCCTHFGYCRGSFRESLARHCGEGVEILDPNEAMVQAVLEGMPAERGGGTAMALRVVSRVPWEYRQLEKMIPVVEQISKPTAIALAAYEHRPDLFTF
ncbi:MAG: aspartate/glutamate racemase family protein [Candidatus Latescibacterota bacterium]|jgi:glutamate racemase